MRIAGIGAAVPEGNTSNAEIETRLSLEPGWIERRTGIRRRPTAARNEATSDLAVRAAEAALSYARVDRSGIGLLLLATSTPDHLLPPTAPLVAHRLGLRAGAVDLAGACSGFVYALVFASQWVQASGKPALVIGANVLSRRLNPMDAATVSLFSDGAGALVIAPHQPTTLLGSYLGSDGSAYETIGIPDGGSRTPLTIEALREGRNLMTMRRGSALFRQAVQGMAEAGRCALESAGLAAADIDLWIPHQANTRVIEDVGAVLGIPAERTVNVVSDFGNSSAATIPIAMAQGLNDARLSGGQTLLLTAAGAGLITASVVLRWLAADAE
jgi:3-oxoacyl-[acyl-carrier-protein] synthase-3